MGQKIGIIIGVGLLVCSMFLFIRSIAFYRDFHAWVESEPVRMPIDFSRSGTVETRMTLFGPYKRYTSIHGLQLLLEFPDHSEPLANPESKLNELRFTCTVRDTNGNEVCTKTVDGEDIRIAKAESLPVALTHLTDFQIGEYVLELTLIEGVPALSGINQQLVVRYFICGMEELLAWVTRMYAFVALGLAGVVFLAVAVERNRQKKLKTYLA